MGIDDPHRVFVGASPVAQASRVRMIQMAVSLGLCQLNALSRRSSLRCSFRPSSEGASNPPWGSARIGETTRGTTSPRSATEPLRSAASCDNTPTPRPTIISFSRPP